ncbi:permease prefix domain 1-containing protein [Clostridium sp. LBM24168]
MFDLEFNIRSWSDHLRSRGKLKEDDILELESHLRDEINDLTKAGLTLEEAFIISVKRLGNVNAISKEYSKINMTTFWKHLLVEQTDSSSKRKNHRNIVLVVLFSLFAGTLAKIPELFGYNLTDPAYTLFYFKNLSLFILPLIALYFLITGKLSWKYGMAVLGTFCLSAIIINLYPSFAPNDTELLTAIHLPILLWLITGILYIGKGWRESKGRMDFLRFTGETIIYGGLVFCGIIVLGMFIQIIFSTIKINIFWFNEEYLFVYGGCASAMVAIYLVEVKKSIVENFAPILAKIFSPLFLSGMAAFLITIIATGKSPYDERNFLIGFDIMLVVVLGLVLYVISARGLNDLPNFFDYMNFALIVMALIINFVALSAIAYRLSIYGISPNKIAALGENLILMINLGGLAILYLGFFREKLEFNLLEKWQTAYLNVYAFWMAVVAFVFPLIFAFH